MKSRELLGDHFSSGMLHKPDIRFQFQQADHMALPIYSAAGSETDLEDGVNFFVRTIDKKYSKNEWIRLIVRSFCILPN